MSDIGYYFAVAQNHRAAGVDVIIAMSDALKLAQGEIDCFRSRLADLEAERALIVTRAENAEAALVEVEASGEAQRQSARKWRDKADELDDRLAAAAAKAETAQAGYLAAVNQSRWQASTNRELNALTERLAASNALLREARDTLCSRCTSTDDYGMAVVARIGAAMEQSHE